MANKNSMICPNCNVPMNHHADKEDQSTLEVIEFHTCPKCGDVATRVEAGAARR
jgi:Zn-finger nucleic acid-binding protein